eukprot:6342731-Pyramimonas_sp.AAC.1
MGKSWLLTFDPRLEVAVVSGVGAYGSNTEARGSVGGAGGGEGGGMDVTAAAGSRVAMETHVYIKSKRLELPTTVQGANCADGRCFSLAIILRKDSQAETNERRGADLMWQTCFSYKRQLTRDIV